MKKLSIALLLVCITMICKAQTSEIKYYKNLKMDEEVSKEKAKYSKTITKNSDGSIVTEDKNLKNNLIERRQILKGEEPIGIWIYLTGKGTAELDYDFTLEYTDQVCPKNFDIKDFFTDNLSISYESPKISTGEQFYEFLGKILVYPAKAVREKIQGKVYLIFDLTKDGTIENIRVKKGVHIVLDKEAVRILRKIKFSSPPKINGQAQNLCVSTIISFQLGF
jgi:TonB family protein